MTRAGGAPFRNGDALAPGEPLMATDDGGTLTRVLVDDSTVAAAQSAAPRSASFTFTGLVPGHAYTATITSTSPGAAQPVLTAVEFSVAPPAAVLHFAVTPADGATASTDAQVTVSFDHDVPEPYRSAVAANIAVIASRDPGDAPWAWTSSRELVFTAPGGWHHGDKVAVVVTLAGIQAGPGLWAVDDTRAQFTVG